MTKQSWKIVFEGKLLDGHKPEIVKKKLASLLKMDPAKIERLFQAGEVTLKPAIDYGSALKFQAVFQRTGGKCRVIQIEEAPPQIEKSEKATPEPEDKTKTRTPSLAADRVLAAFRVRSNPWRSLGPIK